MDFAQILVYILAAFLALFLLLAITLVVFLIRITKQIKDVTNSAQRTVDSVEKTVKTFNSVGSAAGLMGIVTNYMKKRKK